MNQITSASAPIVAVFESASSIRIIMIDNEPWFAAADVCDVLGYANGRDALSKHCRAGGVAKRDTPTNSGIQLLTYINEGNLYRLVIKSRMPAAEKFEAWVCDEVLPSIRKQGYYIAPVVDQEPAQDEALAITEAEADRLRRLVRGIAHCLPTMTPHQVAATIYGRIKSPLRIGRIDDLPAPYFERTMQYLERLCVVARNHCRQQSAIESALLSKMIEGSEVVA